MEMRWVPCGVEDEPVALVDAEKNSKLPFDDAGHPFEGKKALTTALWRKLSYFDGELHQAPNPRIYKGKS